MQCCYEDYTKVMANRMKSLMDIVVSDTQSAFIPGRLISDNIMIAFEVMHYLKGNRMGVLESHSPKDGVFSMVGSLDSTVCNYGSLFYHSWRT